MLWPFRTMTLEILEFFMKNDGRTYQQIAVLGIVVITLGRTPRKNPAYPCCRLIMDAALNNPLAVRMSASRAVPLVCNNVLMTSRGVVRPAATAPASAPAVQWVTGS